MKDGLAIAIDLGATQLRAALVDGEGTVISRAATHSDVPGGPKAITAQMISLVEEVRKGQADEIIAAGVCAPGPLDSDLGMTMEIPTMPGWKGFKLRDHLRELLRVPVSVENDALSAAFGEWQHGAGKGLTHMVYVTVSSGIGGGVIADGKLLRGRRGMATHFGHLMIDENGPRCLCGGTGCFEMLASGSTFNGKAMEAGFTNGPAATAAARAGDAKAQALVTREAEILGYGFSTLLHLYSPERLVIGGGMSAALDLMLPTIRAQIDRHAMPAFRDIDIVRAELADNAGLVGAAALARASLRG